MNFFIINSNKIKKYIKLNKYSIILLCLIILLIIFLFKYKIINNFENKMTPKQLKFKECLSDMKKILDKNNQEFFLVYGTLLGQQREKLFIEHDGDIDIGIFKDKFNPDIKDKILESKKFKFRHDFGKLEDSYECTFIHNNGVSIDIFLHYYIDKNYYYAPSFSGLCNNKKEGYCKWSHHINGLNTITFMNEKYKIPTNAHDYLIERYGKDWGVVKKFNYYQGLEGEYKGLLN